MPADRDPSTPLWRAAQVFRLLSCGYALGFQVAVNDDLDRPVLGWALFAVLLGWSAVLGVGYLRGFARRPAWVIAELVVVAALMLSTNVVASTAWIGDNQSWPTTLWATNAVISAAVLRGPVAGMAVGVAVTVINTVLKGHVDYNLGRNATLVVEVAVGLAVGMAAQTARRAHVELQQATRLAAAVEERERLSRHVHDGVIQVLALVARRGRQIGGDTAELASLAAEQERALRRLVSSTDTDRRDDESLDLRMLLQRRESDQVVLSLPGTAVPLPASAATELDAAVGNVLDNVRLHAGPAARAYVLVEDVDDTVTVSVRDDGVGIAPGRLQEAERQGRIGVSKSIVQRLATLGGQALLQTAPGEGTEWELSVPRRA
ncbi:ATP-binding protein [Mycolicibacillus koreensis]|nr:ATP-binding protein [Mycolicibacillus koreensis]